MDGIIPLLIVAHLIGLVVTVVAALSLFNAGASGAGGLVRMTDRLVPLGHLGLALLWISGPLVVWLKYGGVGGFGTWFWTKMVFVVVLSAALGMGAASYRKARAGDAGALGRARIVAIIALLAGVGAVVSAGFAFR